MKIYDLIKYCLKPATRDLVNGHFSGVMEVGISLIYTSCLQPMAIIPLIVRGCYNWLFGKLNAEEAKANAEEVTYDHEMDEKSILKLVSSTVTATDRHLTFSFVTKVPDARGCNYGGPRELPLSQHLGGSEETKGFSSD
jgi:hypothetical protein